MTEPPAKETLLALHKRLLASDVTAPAELVLAAIEPLCAQLAGHERRDPQLVYDAATDALLDFIKNPTKFNPAKGDPWTYLHLAAKRDLLNLQRSRTRAHNRDLRHSGVAPGQVAGNWMEPSIDEEGLGREAAKQRLLEIERGQVDTMSNADHQILRLIANGERRTGPFAVVLGVESLPEAEQRRAVKNAKDRLLKRLRRAAPE